MKDAFDELPAGKSEYERVDFWIRRREVLDDVVQKPARTLVRLVHRSLERRVGGTFTVPIMIDDQWDEEATYRGGSLLVHGMTCSAVQGLYDDRRRYPWLKPIEKELEDLHRQIPEAFVTHPALEARDLLDRLEVLGDPVFGSLNALTASEIFWVLIRAGERYAHGEVGFLAIFSLLWAMKRRMYGPFMAGVALGRRWRPSVAVTARALFPILQLTRILHNRSGLYRAAAECCRELQANEQAANEHQRWKFAAAVEKLRMVLYRLAEISIEPADVKRIAEGVTALANPIGPTTLTAPIAEQVRQHLRQLFVDLGRQNSSILGGARRATHEFQPELLAILSDEGERCNELSRRCQLGGSFASQHEAAVEAHKICTKALDQLERAVAKSAALPEGDAFTHDVLVSTLNDFAGINDEVALILLDGVKDNIEWCRRAVTNEVAFASSGSDSDFDVAELLSGLAVAQRTQQISRAAMEDGIRHSFRAARSDGSWRSDQPIYVDKHFVGVWPGTVDLLFLLGSVLHSRQGLVHAGGLADRHLLRYVDLMETQRRKRRPKWWDGDEEVWGFPSELREESIDVWASAMSVRALLEIRNVIEDRLWAICEERFTVRHPQTGLMEIDPVDLGARHDQRLQTRLIRNAAATLRYDSDAEYGYVLHGPPGSSKTTIAEALSKEMWKRPEPRFVRITPADFTRRGEDGIDYEARFIFRLLTHVRGVTIVFDEIDDLLRKRKIDADLSFIRLVIPGMLNRLQDLRDAAPRQEICFLLATNYVDQIEPALTRRGRIDATVPLPYPDAWSRESIFERTITETEAKGVSVELSPEVKEAVVSGTAAWPWSPYQKLCGKVIKEKCRTASDVQALVDQFSGDFEAGESYYRNVDRWKTASPLAREFAHFAFGASKLRHECRRRVAEIEAYLRIDDLNLVTRFDQEWRDRGRE